MPQPRLIFHCVIILCLRAGEEFSIFLQFHAWCYNFMPNSWDWLIIKNLFWSWIFATDLSSTTINQSICYGVAILWKRAGTAFTILLQLYAKELGLHLLYCYNFMPKSWDCIYYNCYNFMPKSWNYFLMVLQFYAKELVLDLLFDAKGLGWIYPVVKKVITLYEYQLRLLPISWWSNTVSSNIWYITLKHRWKPEVFYQPF